MLSLAGSCGSASACPDAEPARPTSASATAQAPRLSPPALSHVPAALSLEAAREAALAGFIVAVRRANERQNRRPLPSRARRPPYGRGRRTRGNRLSRRAAGSEKNRRRRARRNGAIQDARGQQERGMRPGEVDGRGGATGLVRDRGARGDVAIEEGAWDGRQGVADECGKDSKLSASEDGPRPGRRTGARRAGSPEMSRAARRKQGDAAARRRGSREAGRRAPHPIGRRRPRLRGLIAARKRDEIGRVRGKSRDRTGVTQSGGQALAARPGRGDSVVAARGELRSQS